MQIAHNVEYVKSSNTLNDKVFTETISSWVRLLTKGIASNISFRVRFPKDGFEEIVIQKDSDLCKGLCFQETVFKKNSCSGFFDIPKDVFHSWLANKFLQGLPFGSKVCKILIRFDGSDIEWIGN